MNVSAIAVRASVTSLALPLVAVFVVSMGFGLVLPVLPFVLASWLLLNCCGQFWNSSGYRHQ